MVARSGFLICSWPSLIRSSCSALDMVAFCGREELGRFTFIRRALHPGKTQGNSSLGLTIWRRRNGQGQEPLKDSAQAERRLEHLESCTSTNNHSSLLPSSGLLLQPQAFSTGFWLSVCLIAALWVD